jgi:hypothetical protein
MWGGMYLHIRLSIYPLVVDMYELFVYLCGVMLGEGPRTLLNL